MNNVSKKRKVESEEMVQEPKPTSEVWNQSETVDGVEIVSELVSELVDTIVTTYEDKKGANGCEDDFPGLDVDKSKSVKCQEALGDRSQTQGHLQAKLTNNKMVTTETNKCLEKWTKTPSTDNSKAQDNKANESNEVIEKAKKVFLQSYNAPEIGSKNAFMFSFNAIECIEPVVADHIKKSYEAQKLVFETVENRNVKEMFLFHGTSLESIKGILNSNFDIQASPSRGKKAMVLGKGIYFSEMVFNSFRYGNSVLLCKVLAGKVQVKERKFCKSGETIPSGWDSRKVGHIYVIPTVNQILPFCIISCGTISDTKAFVKLPPRLRDHSSHTAFLIKSELENIHKDPKPGVFVVTEMNKRFSKIHALVSGGIGTVYEGGLFHFHLYIPPDYPFRYRVINLSRHLFSKKR